ncbi:MAG: flagellar basal body L-ring protein FlgH [Desulfatitalea sp.]|nr:flagellar basal body L-ring protein FlgH [Desulfatitalea sp.]NNJ99562.1 flagellar basal body L-ring protein FlgH [Desulfatitalea sp.]
MITSIMYLQFLSAKGSTFIIKAVGVLWVCAMVWGCASSAPAPPAPQATVESSTMAVPPPDTMTARITVPTDGSLWDERSGLGEMFANVKARRVGDLLTIRITESSSAANSASTTTDRESSLDAGITHFFNAEKSFPADQPFFNPFSRVGGSMSSTFEGTGATKRSGDLNAYMTASVVNILGNGNLVIQGNREVRVNAENLMMTLTGIIRPRDISSDNVIQSTYIADARISYSGSGVINERQKPGWLTRILDRVWPF